MQTTATMHPRRRPFSLGRLVALAGKAIIYLALSALSLLAFFPFLWALFASFKGYREMMTSLNLLPRIWTLDNWRTVLGRINFGRAIANSAFVSITATLAVLVTSAAGGFVFAKYRFWGREQLFTLLLSTMMVPFAVTMVPLYITMAQFGMVDHLAGVIFPSLWSTFGLFLLRQFIESIPSELLDAARIDGASEPWIFVRLIIPMSTSPLAALALFTFLGHWDSFVWPSIVLTSADKQTLPLLLRGLENIFFVQYNMWVTAAMFTIAPIVILYAFLAKFMIRGVAMSGLKF